MKKLILLLALLPDFTFAQYEKEIDSLYQIINSNINPEKKVEPYGQLIEIFFETNPEKSQDKIRELYHLNKNNSCVKCETMADFYMAGYNDINGNREKALAYYEKAAQKSLTIKDYEFYQLAKSFKIHTYFNVGDIPNAEAELDDYFDLTKKLNLKTGYEEMYYTSGLINHKKGFFNTAIEDLLHADKIIVDAKLNKIKLRATVLGEIALTYKDLNNYKKAIEYITKSEEQSKKSQDIYGQMHSKLIRGRIEIEFKNYKNAIVNLEKADAYFKSIQNENFISICEFNLGVAYYHLNEYQKSTEYLKRASINLKNSSNVDVYASCLSFLAKNNLNANQIAEAKKNIETAKTVVKHKKDFPFYLTILDSEIDYYKKTNNYAAALQVISQRDSLSKIISNKSNINNLNELEAKYQNEKKEQQIQLLSAKNELAKKQKYLYIGILGLLILIGGIVFYGYRNKIKTAQKLKELNELKSRFFANISHEFRTPLTLIKSPVQSLQREIIDENQQSKLNLIDTNSSRMLELVDQLLALSKIDSGNLKLILKDGNISSFLTAIVEPFQFQANEKNMHFETSIEKTITHTAFDKDVIEKIVTNLLTNAFKYTPQNEKIAFTTTTTQTTLKLMVSNSGCSLKKESLPKLFERFYQNNDKNQGVGIGLALVKELVELYKGTIETSLESGKLSFIISLPLNKSNAKAVVIPAKIETTMLENQTKSETEFPILLLVDDNAAIRMLLKDLFKEQFTILEAQDGEEALQIAQNEIPDCIISDVMMPKMDGFEFTTAIKNNELTSFIPVVLLTAKTSDQAHLDGLKSTADAFLTKPFNNDIVKASVNQLIAERKKLHLRYSQELVLKPVDIIISSVEEKFIEKLQHILEKELSNSEFSSENFAASAGMSRMQLHRKLKSLLGVSATEFLRNERLKVAVDLLKKGNGNISEIAYAVGFNDVSYFSKCFKEVYSVTPSEYLNSKSTP